MEEPENASTLLQNDRRTDLSYAQAEVLWCCGFLWHTSLEKGAGVIQAVKLKPIRICRVWKRWDSGILTTVLGLCGVFPSSHSEETMSY